MSWLDRFKPGTVVVDAREWVEIREELAGLRALSITNGNELIHLNEVVTKFRDECATLTIENAKLKASLERSTAVTLDDVARRLHIPARLAAQVDWDRVGVEVDRVKR